MGLPSQSQTTFPRGPHSQGPRRARPAQRSEPGGLSRPGFQDRLKHKFEDQPEERAFLQKPQVRPREGWDAGGAGWRGPCQELFSAARS